MAKLKDDEKRYIVKTFRDVDLTDSNVTEFLYKNSEYEIKTAFSSQPGQMTLILEN